MKLYEDFHLVQNLGRKLKGVRGCFFIFDIYYVALKILTYVMSYTEYASLVFEFDLIKAYLSSFRPFSAYLGQGLEREKDGNRGKFIGFNLVIFRYKELEKFALCKSISQSEAIFIVYSEPIESGQVKINF